MSAALDRQVGAARRGRAAPDRPRNLHRRPPAGRQRAATRRSCARPTRTRGSSATTSTAALAHGGRGRRRSPAPTSPRHASRSAVGVTAPVHYYRRRSTGCASSASRWRSWSRAIATWPRTPPRLVGVDYEPLPAVVDPEQALEPDAPDPARDGRARTWPATGASCTAIPTAPSREADVVVTRALQVSQVRLDADRDLRRHRALGPARRRADGVVELHGAVHHASAGGAGAAAAREPAALHRAARHRRLVRHQDAASIRTSP